MTTTRLRRTRSRGFIAGSSAKPSPIKMPIGLRSRRRLGKSYTSAGTSKKPGAGVEPPAKRARLDGESVLPKKLRSRLPSLLPSEDDREGLDDEDMSSEEEDNDRTMMADTTLSPLKPSNVANRLRRVRRTTRSLNQLNGKSKPRKLATSAEVAQYAYSSPRKRKRSSAESEEDEMDGAGDSASVVSLSTTDDYESVDGDESEPDFIDEDDDQLLHKASSAALDRLRKAELVRLWKVAGLSVQSESETDSSGAESEEEDIETMLTKEQLIKGILEARKKPSAESAMSYPSTGRRIARLPSTSRITSAATSATRSSISASGETSSNSSKREHVKGSPYADKRKARVEDGAQSKPRFYVEIPGRSGIQTKDRNRRASHESSAASSVRNVPAKSTRTHRQQTVKEGKQRELARNVSFDGVDDERDQESSVGHADDERVEDGSGTEGSAKGPRMMTRRASQHVHAGGAVHALRSRTKSAKNATSKMDEPERQGKQTPARKGKGKAVVKAKDEGEDDVEMEDVETEQESDDPTPRTRAHGGPVQSPTLKQANMRTRQARRQSLLSSVSSSKSFELSSIPSQYGSSEESDEKENVQASPRSSSAVAQRRRTRGQARQQELENQLESMDITDEETGDQEESGDQDMKDGEDDGQSTASHAKSSVEEEDEDGDGDDEAEAEEFEHELTDATHATLSRLRKDRLIEMCEARELATDGTKKDLIQYLLEWRDATSRERQQSKPPSSTSTAKQDVSEAAPAATSGKASKLKALSVPKLLQNHSTVADPDTPPISGEENRDSNANAVELDLEDLGLVDKEIPASQIQKGERIGSGGFKDVYIGRLRGRMKVAICEFRDQLSEMDIRELKLLSELNHPNIVRLLGVSVPDVAAHVQCMVITELCEKGDLFDYIRNVSTPTFAKILGMMIDIAQGLEYLHERTPKVIHRDCKSSNILINKKGVCKVGDFGLARVKNSTRSVIRSLVGTINWQAPELWHPKPRYDYKVDVFSCAMVYWEMLSGWASDKKEYPWIDRNQFWIIDAVGTKKMRPSTSAIRKRWGSEVVQLLERMWQHDPADRPTMTDVKDDLQAILAEHKKNPKV